MIKECTLKAGQNIVERLKGGVIMDVTTPEQAKIAEDAGAVAVMALERVPADIRAEGGVARMSDPEIILRIVKRSPFPSWRRYASAILLRPKSWRRWELTLLMRVKY